MHTLFRSRAAQMELINLFVRFLAPLCVLCGKLDTLVELPSNYYFSTSFINNNIQMLEGAAMKQYIFSAVTAKN